MVVYAIYLPIGVPESTCGSCGSGARPIYLQVPAIIHYDRTYSEIGLTNLAGIGRGLHSENAGYRDACQIPTILCNSWSHLRRHLRRAYAWRLWIFESDSNVDELQRDLDFDPLMEVLQSQFEEPDRVLRMGTLQKSVINGNTIQSRATSCCPSVCRLGRLTKT